MKLVTVETLGQALYAAGIDGTLVDTEVAFDALPPLALPANVLAAIERLTDWTEPDVEHDGCDVRDCDAVAFRTLIAAVLAGAAERERLRAALEAVYGDWLTHAHWETDEVAVLIKSEVQSALVATPPDAVADEWARLRAIDAAVHDRQTRTVPVVPREEATDAGGQANDR